MKVILQAVLDVAKKLFPKSRWGNVIYLVIGFAIANYDSIAELFQALKAAL